MSEPGGGHEMIIVKRHGGAHDEHHGGVWKIAFADFMTAMMAFFLVMWLISANDKTKATIAKYFNPIELVDSTPQPRGLNDTKKDDPNVERKSETPAPDTKGKDNNPTEKSAPDKEAAAPRPVDLSPMDDADQSARHDELELIRDPYAVIAEIAAKRSADPPTQASTTPAPAKAAGGAGAIGLKNGEAFRDPFEPQSLASAANPLPSVATLEPPPSPVAPAAPLPATTPIPAPPAPMAAVTMDKPEIATAAAPATSGASPAGSAPPPAAASAVPGSPASAAGPVSAGSSQTGATGSAKNGSDGAAAVAATDPGADKPLPAPVLRAKIAALAKATEGPASGGTPKLEVQHTEEGTLISLTDTAEFTMFASASARPSPKTIALMEKIGRLLKAQKGGVTIRGFTDSRPFHSDTYDNWRLSTERAHIAQYMLERGGLDDGRLDRVEGYADRRPKNPKDPEGPENRRIEILLRDTTP